MEPTKNCSSAKYKLSDLDSETLYDDVTAQEIDDENCLYQIQIDQLQTTTDRLQIQNINIELRDPHTTADHSEASDQQNHDQFTEYAASLDIPVLNLHEQTSRNARIMPEALKIVPFALGYLCLIALASQVHFEEAESFAGELYALSPDCPLILSLAFASGTLQAKLRLPSSASVLAASCRFCKTANDTSDKAFNESGNTSAASLVIYLFSMAGNASHPSMQNITLQAAANKLGSWELQPKAEQQILLEVDLSSPLTGQAMLVTVEPRGGRAALCGGLLAVAVELQSLGPSGRYQVLIAGLILVAVFGLMAAEVLHRTMAAMIGAGVALIMLAIQQRMPSLATTIAWMDHGTLGLLWGMMVIVGVTARTGVFEWTGMQACRLSRKSKKFLLASLCLVTALLSAFLDNVTTILLIVPVTIKLCELIKVEPIPYLIAETLFSNLGGTATMIGDPPNILIGNKLNQFVNFNDFLVNLGPGVVLSCIPVFAWVLWYWRLAFSSPIEADLSALRRSCRITDPTLLIKCVVVLACVVLAFFFQSLTRLQPAWAAILGAIWLLVAFDRHSCHQALENVEWDTLIFFACLFVMIQALAELGLLRFVAGALSDLISRSPEGTRQYVAIILILWVSALVSAWIDNIPFTATMLPVLMQLAEKVPGVRIQPLAWALAFGACFGGNGSLIGASANIVMASKAEAEGHRISFGCFFKVGMPAMLISVTTATLYLSIANLIVYQPSTATSAEPSSLAASQR